MQDQLNKEITLTIIKKTNNYKNVCKTKLHNSIYDALKHVVCTMNEEESALSPKMAQREDEHIIYPDKKKEMANYTEE